MPAEVTTLNPYLGQMWLISGQEGLAAYKTELSGYPLET